MCGMKHARRGIIKQITGNSFKNNYIIESEGFELLNTIFSNQLTPKAWVSRERVNSISSLT